jgi:hypothetical protein
MTYLVCASFDHSGSFDMVVLLEKGLKNSIGGGGMFK